MFPKVFETFNEGSPVSVRITHYSSIAPGGRRSEMLLDNGKKVVCHGEGRWTDDCGQAATASITLVGNSFKNKYNPEHTYITFAEDDVFEVLEP